MLQVTTWLAQLSTEGAAQNIPAFISVEAILLQKAQPAAFQARTPRSPQNPAVLLTHTHSDFAGAWHWLI